MDLAKYTVAISVTPAASHRATTTRERTRTTLERTRMIKDTQVTLVHNKPQSLLGIKNQLVDFITNLDDGDPITLRLIRVCTGD